MAEAMIFESPTWGGGFKSQHEMRNVNGKKSLVILISNENYLRNWIRAGAFEELRAGYRLHYVVARESYWDPALLKDYGIADYSVVEQPAYRKFLLRRLLLVTMFKHTRRSKAFRIKMRAVGPRWAWLYRFLALPVLYEVFLAGLRLGLPRWRDLARVLSRITPAAVIAPSLAADSLTIDTTYTANKLGIKSMLLINSWDNLVSKGVLPLPPDCVGVWGTQGIDQATRVQNVPRDRVVALGVPRFDRYFRKDAPKPDIDIHQFNGIPTDKKILLYGATSIPFDDMSALRILDREISDNPDYSDYVILFRPHPEMMKRVGERPFHECGFENVVLDRQLGDFYTQRFSNDESSFPKLTTNRAELEYYPALLSAIEVVVCPPTTLGVEGAMCGVPCLMICYGDKKNTYLSPDQVCQYENVEEILAMPGVVACHSESSLVECFRQAINFSRSEKARDALREATRFVVYRDDRPYAERLRILVDHLVSGRSLSVEPTNNQDPGKF
ncbi:MAG: CDP-glycerol glycerophosphotransferase family protein [Longimicrobiales bacterium]